MSTDALAEVDLRAAFAGDPRCAFWSDEDRCWKRDVTFETHAGPVFTVRVAETVAGDPHEPTLDANLWASAADALARARDLAERELAAGESGRVEVHGDAVRVDVARVDGAGPWRIIAEFRVVEATPPLRSER